MHCTKSLYMQITVLVGPSGILNSTLHRKCLGKNCAAACKQMES